MWVLPVSTTRAIQSPLQLQTLTGEGLNAMKHQALRWLRVSLAPRKTRVPMRTSFIAAARSDRARSDAQPLSTCYRKRDGAIFDLRRCEFIPLLGAAAVYPSPANIQEKIDAAVRPRRVCTT